MAKLSTYNVPWPGWLDGADIKRTSPEPSIQVYLARSLRAREQLFLILKSDNGYASKRGSNQRVTCYVLAFVRVGNLLGSLKQDS